MVENIKRYSSMMVIVTGTSSGIGKAIADFYLNNGHLVVGISRRHVIEHANYQAITCDLSDHVALNNLSFEFIHSDVLLINNAGILGNVQRISDQVELDLATVLAVNTIAPAILMQKLAQQCGSNFPLTVVNISSGAAKRAIPSWAAYCASKAALEMISETFYLEEQEKGRSTKVYAIAPGVVDTGMQTYIRSVHSTEFSASANFHAYFENGELISPEIVAVKIDKLLKIKYTGQVSYSLRDSE